MSSLRGWILLLSIVSFLAGLMAGVLFARRLAPPVVDPGPFADYRARLSESFELSPTRQQALGLVLDLYHRDLEAVKSKYLPEMEPELVKVGLAYRDTIRDRVLPPEQRARFDELALGLGDPAALR